jgi:hypothetical protein
MHGKFAAIQQNHQNSNLFHETIPLRIWITQHISSCSSLHQLIGASTTGEKPVLITVYAAWWGEKEKLIFLLPRPAAMNLYKLWRYSNCTCWNMFTQYVITLCIP